MNGTIHTYTHIVKNNWATKLKKMCKYDEKNGKDKKEKEQMKGMKEVKHELKKLIGSRMSL